MCILGAYLQSILLMSPSDPMESASGKILTFKVVFLMTLTSLKCIGDLQALSVNTSCMDFAPGLAKVFLQPRLGYVLMVASTHFHPQVVVMQSFSPLLFMSQTA